MYPFEYGRPSIIHIFVQELMSGQIVYTPRRSRRRWKLTKPTSTWPRCLETVHDFPPNDFHRKGVEKIHRKCEVRASVPSQVSRRRPGDDHVTGRLTGDGKSNIVFDQELGVDEEGSMVGKTRKKSSWRKISAYYHLYDRAYVRDKRSNSVRKSSFRMKSQNFGSPATCKFALGIQASSKWMAKRVR